MLSIFLTKSPTLHHEVALDREVVQRLDGDRARRKIAQKRVAGELRLAVDHHAAASAHRHAAGPAERQRAVQRVLDRLQRLQHRHVVGVGHFERAERRLVVRGRPIAQRFVSSTVFAERRRRQTWAASFWLLGFERFAERAIGALGRLRLGDLHRAVGDLGRRALAIMGEAVGEEIDVVALFEAVEPLMRAARFRAHERAVRHRLGDVELDSRVRSPQASRCSRRRSGPRA